MAKAPGLEKEVRFVGAGGSRQIIAMLKAGSVDAIIRGGFSMKILKYQGVVRELIRIDKYRPKEWTEHITFAHRDLIRDKPKLVRGLVRGVIQACNFIRNNRTWTIKKLKKHNRYTDEIAKEAYAQLKKGFTTDGRITKKGVQNVMNFLAKEKLVPQKKLPRL